MNQVTRIHPYKNSDTDQHFHSQTVMMHPNAWGIWMTKTLPALMHYFYSLFIKWLKAPSLMHLITCSPLGITHPDDTFYLVSESYHAEKFSHIISPHSHPDTEGLRGSGD